MLRVHYATKENYITGKHKHFVTALVIIVLIGVCG